jgi:hypothetical protein
MTDIFTHFSHILKDDYKKMNLTVPEAAATPDTIQFKLVYINNQVKKQ